jgi:hypothetical protein
MDVDMPTKKISELMRLASMGPDGQNTGVCDTLILQLEVRSRQVTTNARPTPLYRSAMICRCLRMIDSGSNSSISICN